MDYMQMMQLMQAMQRPGAMGLLGGVGANPLAGALGAGAMTPQMQEAMQAYLEKQKQQQNMSMAMQMMGAGGRTAAPTAMSPMAGLMGMFGGGKQ